MTDKTAPQSYAWPIQDSDSLRIVDGLYRCRKFVWENDQHVVSNSGLTWSQMLILEALRNTEPNFTLSPTELRVKAQLTSGGTTKMLLGLEKSGFISRNGDSNDRRRSFVSLTPEGKVAVEKTLNELSDTNTTVFASILSEQEVGELARLLLKLKDGLGQRLENT